MYYAYNQYAAEQDTRKNERFKIEQTAERRVGNFLDYLLSGNSFEYVGNKIGDGSDLSNIIGLPTQAYLDSQYALPKALQQMPIFMLSPVWPEFAASQQMGVSLYTVNPAKGEAKYNSIMQIPLSKLGFQKIPYPVPTKIAFEYEGPFTETFSTEYKESMLEEKVNQDDGMFSQLRFATGADNIKKSLEEINKIDFGAGTALELVKNSAANVAGAVKGLQENTMNNVVSGAGQLMSGSKVDMPMVWAGSSYTANYNITVKLHNPDPTNYKSYLRHIVTPIIMLAGYMTPIADSQYTYSFPVLCRAHCPGLFQIEAGYISNMEISKGSDNGDITFQQSPNYAEIRFTISDLYNTLVGATSSDAKSFALVSQDRPTLNRYIKNLTERWYVPIVAPDSANYDPEKTIEQHLSDGLSDFYNNESAQPQRVFDKNATRVASGNSVVQEALDPDAPKIDFDNRIITKNDGTKIPLNNGDVSNRYEEYKRRMKPIDAEVDYLGRTGQNIPPEMQTPTKEIAMKLATGVPLTENEMNYISKNSDMFVNNPTSNGIYFQESNNVPISVYNADTGEIEMTGLTAESITVNGHTDPFVFNHLTGTSGSPQATVDLNSQTLAPTYVDAF